ncbi:RNase RNM [Cognaticolwellia beringensis]|uniref:PHP domain-containing protein n=1 Tax=Cognaticolwellia beringensis TaxID=1967665 RepID=A0A222GBN9_9GAMM|nr:PHP domain-containing protein [Cognaticolwellia beringensis]ASP49083.1 PHP domain-containing protein [Cognaticolwellia beringensis]
MMSTTDFTNDKDFSNLRVDLHSHTNCSDGALTPKELIERAVNFQIDVLAITDHDSVKGLDSAKQTILDQNIPLTLIDGIEISTQWQGFEIHIVGLNIQPEHPELQSLISAQQQRREDRALSMGDKLEKCGFNDVYSQAKEMAGEGSITRAHFAKVLLHRGIVSKMQAAFDKYIGKGKRAYVNPNWCSIEEAIATIHAAGGVAVMAHPIRYDLTAKWLRRLIVHFKSAQGDGLEVVLPQMNNEQRKIMLSYCSEYDLHASMGSDFHQPSRWSDLGRNLVMPEQAKPIWQLWQTKVIS